MMHKKISIIAIVAIAAGVAAVYVLDELAPPATTRVSGEAQYADRIFGEQVEMAGVVLEGKVTDVKVKVFTEKVMEYDENGNQVVFETLSVPRAEVTIKADKVLKDNYGLDSKTIVAYDRAVSDAIGAVNGEKARFVHQDAYDYEVGEEGIFLIENDEGLWIDGFTSFYPIVEDKLTIKSEFDKKYGKEPMALKDARDIIDSKAEESKKKNSDQ